VVKYDWVITTRWDIFFKAPFVIDNYWKQFIPGNPPAPGYERTQAHSFYQTIDLPSDPVFIAHNFFSWMNVFDVRFVNEGDLLWFCKPNSRFLEIAPIKIGGGGDNVKVSSEQRFLYCEGRRENSKIA